MFGAVEAVERYRQVLAARTSPAPAQAQQGTLRLPDLPPPAPVPSWLKWGAVGLGVVLLGGIAAAALRGGRK